MSKLNLIIKNIRLTKFEYLLTSILIIIAIFLRFYDLSSRAVHHDESLHGFFSWQFANGMGYDHNPLMHGIFWFIANGSLFFLFGDNDFTLRLLPAIFGIILALIPIFFLKEKIGFFASFIMALIFVFSPHLLYFSRFARNDIIITVWTMGLFVFLWRYLEKRHNLSLYFLVVFLVLGFITKETTYITVFIFGLWLLFKSRIDLIGLIFLKKKVKDLNPCTDLFIVFFTLCLPLSAPLSGIFQNLFGLILVAKEGTLGVSTGLPSGFLSYIFAIVISISFFIVSFIIGLLWGGRKWLMLASLFWGLYILFYSTFFTNLPGIGTGIWQSLGYWISQQDVARGGQPWYYYFIVLFSYEFLPLICTFIASIYYIFKGDSFKKFLVFWFISTIIFYSLAGEKMPWLTVNIIIPMIILTSVFSADIFKKIYREKLISWFNVFAILLPIIILFTIFSLLITNWSNLNIESFVNIWIYITIILGSSYYLIFYIFKYGFNSVFYRLYFSICLILMLFTIKISIQTSFDNPDVPDEMIVYTQTSPHLHDLSRNIYSKSLRQLGDKNLEIIIDSSDGYTWPWAWYLRDFKNADYVDFDNFNKDSELHADVLIIHERNQVKVEKSYGEKLNSYNYNLIPHRWWFPEVYRITSYNDFLNRFSDYKKIQNITNYLLFRDLETSIGSVNSIVYFKTYLY